MALGNAFKKLREGHQLDKWFKYPAGGRVSINYLPSSKLNAISARCRKAGTERLDGNKINVELGRKAVNDWEGFVFEDGDEYPYSRKNCDDLMENDYDFKDFVNEKSTDLREFEEEREEGKKKESAPSS